jgi:hypothetical protein
MIETSHNKIELNKDHMAKIKHNKNIETQHNKTKPNKDHMAKTKHNKNK